MNTRRHTGGDSEGVESDSEGRRIIDDSDTCEAIDSFHEGVCGRDAIVTHAHTMHTAGVVHLYGFCKHHLSRLNDGPTVDVSDADVETLTRHAQTFDETAHCVHRLFYSDLRRESFFNRKQARLALMGGD